MKRKDMHVEIIKYLIQENTIEPPLRLIHYPDWVPAKKEVLTQKQMDQFYDISTETISKDFRLRCKNQNCKRKTEFYCRGCSNPKFVCSLCVPDCFIHYHKHMIRF